MKFDIEGRIKNMRLPDGQTALLYSVFEAVMNGVQAIEERFANGDPSVDGRIRVEVLISKSKHIQSIVVKDNGLGLNPTHFDAFNVCDTRQKASIGGRGVGRLIWLKAFTAVSAISVYEDADQICGLSFDFRPDLDD